LRAKKGSVLIFRAPDCTLVDFWPDVLAPRVRVADEFLLLPLLPGVASDTGFWLLTLSMKSVRLYRGSGKGLAEVVLPQDIAKSLEGSDSGEDPDHSSRARSSAGPSVGNMKGVQFDTSNWNEHLPGRLHDFYKEVDRGIQAILTHDPQPLILAAVPRELAAYRKVNTCSPVLAGAIHGSPDMLGTKILYERATQLMASHSAMAAEGTLREMEEAANRGCLISDCAEIVAAASAGSVDELVLTSEAPELSQHEDAVNWAALATIRNSGRVRFLNSGQMPSGMAAILRFRPADIRKEHSYVSPSI
jgi:Bacterial archaeo-eukaryotic release factor family 3